MTRLLALLVAMGLVIAADRSYTRAAPQDEKKEEKKKEEKKEEKKEAKLTDEQKAELKAISGKFTVVTFERDGQKATAAEIKGMKVEQSGEKWKFISLDSTTEGTDVVYPDQKPKGVDSTYTNGPDAGKTVKGIYKVEGDSITYCWAEIGKDRPKDFSGAKGFTMMVIKRAAEGKKDEKKDEKKEEKKDEKKKDE